MNTLVHAARIAAFRRSFPHFARHELKIKTKAATLQPFRLYEYQQRLVEGVATQLATRGLVRQIWLKNRQAGTSTLSQGLVFWRTALNDYTNAIVVAHEVGPAAGIFEIARRYYQNLSDDVRPEVRYSTKTELVFDTSPGDPVRGRNSKIVVATAKNVHSGASGTFQVVHLSEAARYTNPKEIESSTLQTVPEAAGTMVLIESTARPEGHWFRAMCDAARAGHSGYQFQFIGWPEDPSCRMPLPHPLDAYLDSYTDEERALSRQFLLLPEQIEFRRSKLAAMLGDADAFNQEFPIDYESAWVTKEFRVFQLAHLAVLRKGVRPPRERRTLAGQRFVHSERGELSIWELPQPGAGYDIGADVALGVEGGDWSVAQVLKRPTGEQVAEFRALCEPSEFADAISALGHWYNMAQVAVETNSIGYHVNAVLTKRYPNCYLWRRHDRIDAKLSHFTGWETTQKTKRWLVARAKDRVYRYAVGAEREAFALIKSEVLWREMSTFVQTDLQAFGAAPGSHDDCVMAWAIANIANDDDGYEPGSHVPEAALELVGADPAATMSYDEADDRWGRVPTGDFWGERDGWHAHGIE